MSKHWRPHGRIVRVVWTNPEAYGFERGPKVRGAGAVLVLGAVFVGLFAAAIWQNWPAPQSVDAKPDAPIEWNAVQAVPRRALSPDEIEWLKRGEEPLAPAVEQAADVPEAGLPRASGARNDGFYVYDGDTFRMGSEVVRIAGMDAPETHPPRCMDEARLGLAATEKLRSLLASGPVTMSGTIHDRYGRDVREVHVGGRNVAEIMIGAGLARSYDGGKRQGWC